MPGITDLPKFNYDDLEGTVAGGQGSFRVYWYRKSLHAYALRLRHCVWVLLKGPRPTTAQRPKGPVAQPCFSTFFCPSVNPRACTDLPVIWACKIDDGEFELSF